MHIIAPWTEPNDESLWPQWQSWDATPVDPRIAHPPSNCHRDRYWRVVGRYCPQIFEAISSAILRYDVFPADLGSAVTPLKRRGRPRLEVYDTVMFCWKFVLGYRLGFGCRVSEVFWEPERRGFSYQTLMGHPELGEETFQVVRTSDDLIEIRLECWSNPGTWLCRLTYPLARHWQVQGARRILDHLESVGRNARQT